MRIGHYAPALWAPGGIASFVQRLGEGQAARGHDVTYLTSISLDPDRKPTLVASTVAELFDAAARISLDVLHLHKDVDTLPASGGRPVRIVRTMHGNQASCPTGSRFLERGLRPCDRVAGVLPCAWGHIVDRCGSIRPGTVRRHVRRYRTERAVLPQLMTHTVSNFLRDRMIDDGYEASRLVALRSPAPVHLAEPPPPPVSGIPRFVFIGRLVPAKGARWLLESIRLTREQFHVDIAGDGYELDALRRLVHQSDLGHRVTFHGWIETNGLQGLIAASRAVVFPSIWHEPAGLVTLEAAANGRAVVASRVGGIPEYALPEFAVLVEPNDTRGLARCLDQLATDYDRAAAMGRAGWHVSQSVFSLGAYLDGIDTLYASA